MPEHRPVWKESKRIARNRIYLLAAWSGVPRVRAFIRACRRMGYWWR